MKKTAASVLLLLIAWFSWPLWTALTIREAVLTGDTAVLERKIDWPGVRASLKQSLPVYLAGQGVIAQTLTALFGTTVVDTIVDFICFAIGPCAADGKTGAAREPGNSQSALGILQEPLVLRDDHAAAEVP